MADRLFDQIRAIDTDTHITEPADLWTSRVSTQKWGDAVPHVKQLDGRDIWFIRDQPVGSPGFTTMAGFNGSIPDSPMGFDDIPKSSWDAHERLAHMDAEGIHAQVLYPNVGGFSSGSFSARKPPEPMWKLIGTPASCAAAQKGSQWGVASDGSPQVSGCEQASTALWPFATARSTSFTHSFTSQKGMAATGTSRFGSAPHHSARKSL